MSRMSKKITNKFSFVLLCFILSFYSTSQSANIIDNLKIQNWIENIPILSSLIDNSITSGIELRPPLENFSPIETTTERALENRVADIEIRTNDLVDETDSQANINNNAIEAFSTVDNDLQQSVDISA